MPKSQASSDLNLADKRFLIQGSSYIGHSIAELLEEAATVYYI